MLGEGVSAAVRTGEGGHVPLLDTLQQSYIVKPLLGQANITTSHPVFDSWYHLFRDAGEPGDDFFNQTKARDVVLECYTWNGSQRGFQRPRNLLSL